MNEWIIHVLEAPGLSLVMLWAAFLLGIISASISVCNIAVIGAIAGYAGASESSKKRDSFIMAIGFTLGSILALTTIGALIGHVGQAIGENFGRYSRILTGIVLVFLGLLSLGLVPFKLPLFKQMKRIESKSISKSILLGFALGSSSITCTISCGNPGLLVILGTVGLQGQLIKSTLTLGIFALGYSIPLALMLFGISFGRWTLRASKIMPFVKRVAAILLLGIGIYFLITV